MDKNDYIVNLDPEYLEQQAEKMENRVASSIARDVRRMSDYTAAESTEDDDDDDEITEEEYRAMVARKKAAREADEYDGEEALKSEYRPRRNQGRPDSSASDNRRRANGQEAVRRNPAGRNGSQEAVRRNPAARAGNQEAARRNPAGKNGGQGRSDRNRENAGRGNRTASGSGNYGNGRRTGGAGAQPRKKRRLPIYWICLGIYVLILFIIGWRFLAYTDKCLVQYENSQSDNAMKNYLTEFRNKVADGTLTDSISIPAASGEFESADVYKNIYLSQFEGVSSYTYEKDSASYLTEEPVYNVFADKTLVAKVTLSASNERTIFGILTIMDWNVKEIKPVFTAGSYDYTISVPSDYKVTINGVALNESYRTGNVVENPDFANVSEYVTMPSLVEYKVTELVNEPEIKVYNAAGEEIEYTPDENGNITVDYQKASSEMPQEYYDDALKMAQTWEDFLTRDLSGDNYGLGTIQQYLIKDSYYWDIAESYAHGVDITFISNHTMLDPPYSNISITDYISYGENCYSCHIYFEKNMYLTKTGETRVDTIDSTFYFVKYDDSDDGVDNPHWAIVDMIATTN